MAIRFDGQVAIVTGAGRGLGRAYALALAERGAKLVVNDLGASLDGSADAPDAAQDLVAEIRDGGGEAIADGGSVSDGAGVAGLVERAMQAFGRIDILINNAGILRDRSAAKMSIEEFDAVLDVHVRGAWRTTSAVWPIMRQQNYGRVVMASSGSGLYGNFGQANYAAAKLAVVGLMKALRIEGEKYGIRTNAVAPAALTRMTEGLFPPEAEGILTAERVTPGVLFLCSRDAPSGAVLAAGGGAFALSRIVETPGAFLGSEATVEDVAENWARIADPQGERELASVGEQTAKFLEMAGGRSEPP